MRKEFFIIGVMTVVVMLMPITAAFAEPLTGSPVQLAQTLLPFQNAEKYPGVKFDIVKDKKGAEGVLAFVKDLFKNLRQLLGPLLVFFIVGVGMQLVISQGEEEAFNSAMRNFKYLLAGTAIVVFSQEISNLFSLYQGTPGGETTFLSGVKQMGEAQNKFKGFLATIIIFLRYLLGGVAVFYVVKSGLSINRKKKVGEEKVFSKSTKQ
jgi:hypothetical protein